MIRRRSLAAALLLLLPFSVALAGENPLNTAQEQFQEGHFSDAINTLQGAIHSSPAAALYYWLGRCYFELRNYRDAALQDEEAVKLDPQNSDYHLWLARADGRQAENGHSFWMAVKSRGELEEAVRLDPKNIPARRDLSEFYFSAPWIVGGNNKRSRDEIDAIATLDPVQGGLAQAEYDRKTGDVPGAESEYRLVLEAKPTHVEEYYEIADFFASRGETTLIEQAVNGAAAVAPTDPRLGYYRGVILVIEGQQLTDAESYLKAYLAATPDRSDYPPHANARTWLGHVYEKMGNRLEAAEQYRAALGIDPSSEFAKQSLRQLEKQVN